MTLATDFCTSLYPDQHSETRQVSISSSNRTTGQTMKTRAWMQAQPFHRPGSRSPAPLRPRSVLTQHEGAEAAGHALGQVVHVQLHRVQRRRLLHGDARPPAGRRRGRDRGAAPNATPGSVVRTEKATPPLRVRLLTAPFMRRRGSEGRGWRREGGTLGTSIGHWLRLDASSGAGVGAGGELPPCFPSRNQSSSR